MAAYYEVGPCAPKGVNLDYISRFMRLDLFMGDLRKGIFMIFEHGDKTTCCDVCWRDSTITPIAILEGENLCRICVFLQFEEFIGREPQKD